MAPLLDVRVGMPQASVTVAEPRAALIAAVVGLHPSGVSLPLAVIIGIVASTTLTSIVHGALLQPFNVVMRLTV